MNFEFKKRLNLILLKQLRNYECMEYCELFRYEPHQYLAFYHLDRFGLREDDAYAECYEYLRSGKLRMVKTIRRPKGRVNKCKRLHVLSR